MFKISNHRVLIAGILASPAAAFLGLFVYVSLTRASSDRQHDFVFRLTMVTIVMAMPFLFTLLLALSDRRHQRFTMSGKIGLALGLLSLGLTWLPASGLVRRSRQERTLAATGVKAPLFETSDIFGKPHRLQDHLGKVVIINAWATWCPPCKKEMPQLDTLYRKHKDEGLMVFGLSTEDVALQRKFATEQVSVTYPLLATGPNVPGEYWDIQAWPAIFLIDRQGRLQPAPQPGASFDKIESAVESLLKAD
jgi:peroxiredoxin